MSELATKIRNAAALSYEQNETIRRSELSEAWAANSTGSILEIIKHQHAQTQWLLGALLKAIESLEIISYGCTEKGFKAKVDVEEAKIGLAEIAALVPKGDHETNQG